MDTSDPEALATALSAELDHQSSECLDNLFEAVHEADEVHEALASLRRCGVEAVDPLLSARMDVLEQARRDFLAWTEEQGLGQQGEGAVLSC